MARVADVRAWVKAIRATRARQARLTSRVTSCRRTRSGSRNSTLAAVGAHSTIRCMAPRSRPPLVGEPVEAKLPPEVAQRVREGFTEAQRGEFVDLSPEETDRYIETGELPERVERWHDSYDFRRAPSRTRAPRVCGRSRRRRVTCGVYSGCLSTRRSFPSQATFTPSSRRNRIPTRPRWCMCLRASLQAHGATLLQGHGARGTG